MQLSKNFSVAEFERSQKAARLGIVNKMTEADIVRARLLCAHVLQPARDVLGAITINSGFRNPKTNRAVGGSAYSDHLKGRAADIVPTGSVSLLQLGYWIQENCDFKQLILEYDQWIHVSYHEGANRKEIIRIYRESDTKKIVKDRSYRFALTGG